jgi:hypothetical protein
VVLVAKERSDVALGFSSMKRTVNVVCCLAAALASLAGSVSAQPSTPHPCTGTRWPIKTLSDSAASSLPDKAVATTVDAMLARVPPANPDAISSRVPPVETTLWIVRARLVGYRLENDADYHVIIADLHSGRTMLAEIPSPDCVQSRQRLFAAERTFVDALGGHKASSDNWDLTRGDKAAPIVDVVGYGFFDHVKQEPDPGAAPNGIEIHPVLQITAVKSP